MIKSKNHFIHKPNKPIPVHINLQRLPLIMVCLAIHCCVKQIAHGKAIPSVSIVIRNAAMAVPRKVPAPPSKIKFLELVI